jgi:hypothetical protein
MFLPQIQVINYYKMTTIHNTTITEPVYLPADCWCEVLSFVTDEKDRFKVSTTNKDIYTSQSLKNSFTGQTVDLSETGITDAGLAYLSNVKEIDLNMCENITDAGLAHLENVEKIVLSDCENITDDGLVHLRNVEDINLSNCNNITNDGLAHLRNVKKIDLSNWDCLNITYAGLAHLSNVDVYLRIALMRDDGSGAPEVLNIDDYDEEELRLRGVNVIEI